MSIKEKRVAREKKLLEPKYNTLGEQLVVDIERLMDDKGGKKRAIHLLAAALGYLVDHGQNAPDFIRHLVPVRDEKR